MIARKLGISRSTVYRLATTRAAEGCSNEVREGDCV